MDIFQNKFQNILEEEFISEKKYKYQEEFIKNRDFEIDTERIQEELDSDDDTIDAVYFQWILRLAIFHFEYAIYLKTKNENDLLAEKHLSLFNQYGFTCLKYASESFDCFKGKKPFIIQNKATFILSNLLLLSDIKQFNKIGDYLIDSLNGKASIIKKGYKNSTISWFILKIYSLYSNKEITTNKLLLPKEEFPYKEILENWNTEDVTEINKYIEFLCASHTAQAKLDYEVHLEEIEENDYFGLKYKELFLVSLYQLPFEVLFLLKLRELKGLKNPKEFTHPLMNTDITKIFLEIKEPLPKPKELPYAKELLLKLKEKCPTITVDDEFFN